MSSMGTFHNWQHWLIHCRVLAKLWLWISTQPRAICWSWSEWQLSGMILVCRKLHGYCWTAGDSVYKMVHKCRSITGFFRRKSWCIAGCHSKMFGKCLERVSIQIFHHCLRKSLLLFSAKELPNFGQFFLELLNFLTDKICS